MMKNYNFEEIEKIKTQKVSADNYTPFFNPKKL